MTALTLSIVALWISVIVLALGVLALVRQLRVLHERITPVGALMLATGLQVGALAPSVNVETLDGRAPNVGAVLHDARATLIMFVSPTCPVCKALLPVLESSRRTELAWLDIVLVSDDGVASQQEFIRSHRLESFPYVVSSVLGVSYQVSRLPFAALIGADGVLRARGIVNSREHLESLFEAKRLGIASIRDYFESFAQHRAA